MREKLIEFLNKNISEKLDFDKLIEKPKIESQGDFALPMFILSKEMKKNPVQIAKEFEEKLSKNLPVFLEKVQAMGPYVNFYLNKGKFVEENLNKVLKFEEKFLNNEIKNLIMQNKSKTILIDYSSPNIAKPLSIGHLRNTVIGQFLCNLYKHTGHKVIGINHLGDFGTQFGILIAGFEKYSKLTVEEVKKLDEPNKYLVDIYIKINDDISKEIKEKGKSEIKEKAKVYNRAIEEKKEPYHSIWKDFVDAGIKELKKTYEKINVHFDYWIGESFYEDKTDEVIRLLIEKNIAKKDEGALIVDILDKNLGVAVAQRSDGGSLYLTRDIAAAVYRKKRFEFDKCLYVVGQEQRHHFKQLFEILGLLGYETEEFDHISYGLLSFKGEKMSTRKGNLIFLEDIVEKASRLALENINEKSPSLKNKEKAAKVIGLGAAFFGDLKNDRIKDVSFDWDRVLDFKGDTSVYLQYTYARINSILRKSRFNIKKTDKGNLSWLNEPEEYYIVKHIFNFENVLTDALKYNKSSSIAEYLLILAQKFNDYYVKHKIIQENKEVEMARLVLIYAVSQTIKEGLKILNIEVLEEM